MVTPHRAASGGLHPRPRRRAQRVPPSSGPPDPRVITYVVVAYDIDDNNRRQRLADLLAGFGERVQRSVFEADLNGRELHDLLQRLERFAQPGDAIRVYRLPPHVAATTLRFGGPPLVHTPNVTIL